MIEFYQTTCELVLKYKDNKDVGVRKHVITLIPSMATYDSQAFVTHYMHRGMAYLLQSLGKPTDRDFGALPTIMVFTNQKHTSPLDIWPCTCRAK